MTASKGPKHPQMHAEQVRDAVQSKTGAAASPIVASWTRSMKLHGLDPEADSRKERVDETDFNLSRERLGRLMSIAAPNMDRLFSAVGNTGCSVFLTDDEGLIVDQRSADADHETFRAWGLWRRGDWSERAEGTNGIGTCIIEQRPVIIHRDDHFQARNTVMSCMGAPVFDHQGQLAAVLDVSSCRADMTDGFAALISNAVVEAAQRIEKENFQAAYAGHRVIVGESDGPQGAVLMAVDSDDLLIGATRRARRMFGLKAGFEKDPRPVADILSGKAAPLSVERAERAVMRQALARHDGNASAAARELGMSRATFYRRLEKLGLS